MQTTAVKFGGSSLADAEQFKKAAAIIMADPARRFVVASAPGKRSSADTKVTDLLYQCFDAAAPLAQADPTGGESSPEESALPEAAEAALQKISERFAGIIRSLEIDFPLEEEIEKIRRHLRNPQRAYMASRGEYLNSRILAAYLGFDFIDAAEVICFDEEGRHEENATCEKLGAELRKHDRAVIPGFYGAKPDGTIVTFSRGGSDVTGSLVARAAYADLYENWTDVSGMLFTDPRIVPNPPAIEAITYKELRELSYMGASVMHEDAVFPVRKAGIPINIRNTNRPEDRGTMIVSSMPADGKRPVTGIAGKKGFVNVQVEKSLMNSEVGFGARLMDIFAAFGVPFEHCPTGIDTMSVIVHQDEFRLHREEIVTAIKDRLNPDTIVIENGLAMIAVVGRGMISARGMAARVFGAVAAAGVNIRMIDQGSGELNIIIGIDESDYEQAVRGLFKEFAGAAKAITGEHTPEGCIIEKGENGDV